MTNTKSTAAQTLIAKTERELAALGMRTEDLFLHLLARRCHRDAVGDPDVTGADLLEAMLSDTDLLDLRARAQVLGYV